MKLSEIHKLDRIINRLENLARETDDGVATKQLCASAHALLILYNSVVRDCKATERTR